MTSRSFRYPAVALAAALVILGAWVPAVRADVVVLADGRKIEGTVKREGDVYVITGRFGTTTRVPVYEVAEIRKTKSSFDDFTKKRDALEAKGDKATAEEWFELATFAVKQNLTKQARDTYEKVISLDPAHEEAHKALGHVRYEGTWMTEERAMALKGMVKVDGRWVRRDDAGDAARERSTRRRERRPDSTSRADAAAKAFAVDYENCPRCSGSCYEIIVKCLQCARSKRPGWCYFGEGFRLCMTCKGTTRVPAMVCRHCKGRGKVDPNKPLKKARVRPIPGGYQRCHHCSGSGGLEWQKCRQCARSEYPGVMKIGPYRYMECIKCKGTAKKRLLTCYHCQGSGMIPETR
ncbi:MAG: hypothetical protein ACYTFI_08520 [Planctomycetota bacterium]|jgi:hypothetical protein